jgi:hypothetical protein
MDGSGVTVSRGKAFAELLGWGIMEENSLITPRVLYKSLLADGRILMNTLVLL